MASVGAPGVFSDMDEVLGMVRSDPLSDSPVLVSLANTLYNFAAFYNGSKNSKLDVKNVRREIFEKFVPNLVGTICKLNKSVRDLEENLEASFTGPDQARQLRLETENRKLSCRVEELEKNLVAFSADSNEFAERLVEAETKIVSTVEANFGSMLTKSIDSLRMGLEQKFAEAATELRASIESSGIKMSSGLDKLPTLMQIVDSVTSFTPTSAEINLISHLDEAKKDIISSLVPAVTPAVVDVISSKSLVSTSVFDQALGNLREGIKGDVSAIVRDSQGDAPPVRSFAEIVGSTGSGASAVGRVDARLAVDRRVKDLQRRMASSVPTLIIRYKADGTSPQCRDFLYKHISLDALGLRLRGSRNVARGVALEFCSKDELDTLMDFLNKEVDVFKDFEYYIPKKRRPQFIIKDISETLSQDEFKGCLATKNKIFEASKFEVDFVMKTNRGTHFVVSVDPGIYIKVAELDYVYIGWQRSRIQPFDSVRQCTNCGRLGHTTGKCEFQMACFRCSSDREHDDTSCKLKCVNCVEHNNKFGTRFGIRHHCRDRGSCQSLQKAKVISNRFIDYGH